MTKDPGSIFEVLTRLSGDWVGSGTGQYPTIESFEYAENLNFEVDDRYPLIHYEQRAFLLPDHEPSHWESGFIRVLESGEVEISNSQDGGRVEVLRGQVQVDGSDEFTLELTSVVLGNDPRLVETRRIITLKSNELSYRKFMATNTTDDIQMLNHLNAILRKPV